VATKASDVIRDVLSPREVAERAGFSYHAILRAIRRGDLEAFEPVSGHYRIELAEYERWLRRPAARYLPPRQERAPRRERKRPSPDPTKPGSFARLRALESSP
jgi:excisionase family DNA binding protein